MCLYASAQSVKVLRPRMFVGAGQSLLCPAPGVLQASFDYGRVAWLEVPRPARGEISPAPFGYWQETRVNSPAPPSGWPNPPALPRTPPAGICPGDFARRSSKVSIIAAASRKPPIDGAQSRGAGSYRARTVRQVQDEEASECREPFSDCGALPCTASSRFCILIQQAGLGRRHSSPKIRRNPLTAGSPDCSFIHSNYGG